MPLDILVTGGSGFLGHAVLLAIREAHPDWTLHNLDQSPPIESSSRFISGVHFVEANIIDTDTLEAAFANIRPRAVIHVAGVVPNGPSRYSSSKAVWERTFKVNVDGTRNVLSAAKPNGCTSFVYTSSCTVLSDDLEREYPNMKEDWPGGRASLAYGSSKWAAENLVLSANEASPSSSPTAFATCALRPATIIGAGDTFGVTRTIASLIKSGQTPFIIGDGDNLFDFMHISSAAYAHLLALENLLPEAGGARTAAGQAFFVSNQEPVYFRDFMVSIWARLGHVPPFQIRVPRSVAWGFGLVSEGISWMLGREGVLSRGSVKDAVGTRYSCNDKAVRILGYRPKVGLDQALQEACEDVKSIWKEEAGGREMRNDGKSVT